MTPRRRIDFRRVAADSLRHSDTILPRWLPGGRREGAEWIAFNPTRGDRRRGSFKVNMRTGAWSDFATGDRGGDLVSLAAYLFRLRQIEAVERVAEMIGVDPYAH